VTTRYATTHWLELTQAGTTEKVRIRLDTVVGIRPCGTGAYGTNVDVTSRVGMVAVEEPPDAVWEMLTKLASAVEQK
jgi:hypothetical protein